jgi:hypothetical protein
MKDGQVFGISTNTIYQTMAFLMKNVIFKRPSALGF